MQSGPSISGSSATAAEPPLTVGYLLKFSLPLAMTFFMMSGAAPLVSNGITWSYDENGEAVHLAAFLLTFATALLIYSPMFVARNVAIRTIVDRRSLLRFATFFVLCGSVSALLLAVVSQVDTVGHLVFGTLLGASAEVEQLAREGLLVFTPIPILVGLRGLGQGSHINSGHTWYVGAGTLLRLGVMAIFVFGYAVHHNLTGPILGATTYLLGIGAETLFVLVTLRGRPHWTQRGSGELLTLRQFSVYAVPLMAASACSQLVGPLLIVLISRGREPLENGATFNLMRDTAWLLFSVLNTIQPAVVAHATSRQRLRTLIRFSGLLVAGVTGVALVVALTPIRESIFINWLEVDTLRIRALTFTTLLWLIPVPLGNMLALFTAALHTRSGRTLWVTAGNVGGLLMLWASVSLLDLSVFDGVVVAVLGNALFHLTAAAVQSVGLLNDGLTAAITPGGLAEQLNAETDDIPPNLPDDAELIPERVQA